MANNSLIISQGQEGHAATASESATDVVGGDLEIRWSRDLTKGEVLILVDTLRHRIAALDMPNITNTPLP